MTETPSFTAAISSAFRYPCRDPIKLLALAVILRWRQDGARDDIGQEWVDAADVPESWIREAAHAG